jgi:hypothetical protein
MQYEITDNRSQKKGKEFIEGKRKRTKRKRNIQKLRVLGQIEAEENLELNTTDMKVVKEPEK